ncbi:hypothetical protein H0H92_003520 [Tricholoma furcatifolium]|nr:hypothetical protein H0H92_003520 [Tricholoma furcatifolium]
MTANGLTSIGFPTVFPLSFRLRESHSLSHCEDNRNAALAFNIIITWILFVVLRPRAIVLYWSLVCIGFWHITLFSQPRASPPDLSDGFGTFLPTLFIAYALWRLAFRFVMPAFSKAPFEASILFLAPYWVGVLTNITFAEIPINRLTASDLKRSGAITALVIIIIVVAILALNQLQEDGPSGSILPSFFTNASNFNSSVPFLNQTIAWNALASGWDGFALLVDDVERYTGTALNFSLAAFDPTLPHFFRLAYTSGDDTGDFTMPATLWPNGTWVDPAPGPS